MRIGILGAGRLGRTLALLLGERGHQVDLRGRGGVPEGEVILLTVPDAALPEAARSIPRGPIVLHCSGAAEVDVLRPHRPAGSLHPLMTFPGPEIAIPDLHGAPAALAGDPDAVEVARELVHALGMEPFEVSGDRRLYHAAAVMAGNFATILLAESATVLSKTGVEASRARRLLAPLAMASLRNAQADPVTALTGPVARGDQRTIESHREGLREAGLENLLPLYDALTERAHSLVSSRATRPVADEG